MVTTNFQVKIGDFGMARDVKLTDYYRLKASGLLVLVYWLRVCISKLYNAVLLQVYNLPGIASQFAIQNPGFAIILLLLYCKTLKVCEACMLHSRVIVQALRWIVEIATQEK